jgi:Microtubule binding
MMLNACIVMRVCACRRLHNTIQELKGNIRVFARIRPALGNSNSSSDAAVDVTQYAATQGLTVQLPDNDPEKRKLILFGPARETVSGSKGELKCYDFQVCCLRLIGSHVYIFYSINGVRSLHKFASVAFAAVF